jgi:hypothetical protein
MPEVTLSGIVVPYSAEPISITIYSDSKRKYTDDQIARQLVAFINARIVDHSLTLEKKKNGVVEWIFLNVKFFSTDAVGKVVRGGFVNTLEGFFANMVEDYNKVAEPPDTRTDAQRAADEAEALRERATARRGQQTLAAGSAADAVSAYAYGVGAAPRERIELPECLNVAGIPKYAVPIGLVSRTPIAGIEDYLGVNTELDMRSAVDINTFITSLKAYYDITVQVTEKGIQLQFTSKTDESDTLFIKINRPGAATDALELHFVRETSDDNRYNTLEALLRAAHAKIPAGPGKPALPYDLEVDPAPAAAGMSRPASMAALVKKAAAAGSRAASAAGGLMARAAASSATERELERRLGDAQVGSPAAGGLRARISRTFSRKGRAAAASGDPDGTFAASENEMFAHGDAAPPIAPASLGSPSASSSPAPSTSASPPTPRGAAPTPPPRPRPGGGQSGGAPS